MGKMKKAKRLLQSFFLIEFDCQCFKLIIKSFIRCTPDETLVLKYGHKIDILFGIVYSYKTTADEIYFCKGW